MKKLIFILILMLFFFMDIHSQESKWEHPSQTWDKYQIGTISVSSGCLLVFSAFTFTKPGRLGYSLYGTGVALSVGGAVYWIIGEERYYKRLKSYKSAPSRF
jgi:hypothetical protein